MNPAKIRLSAKEIELVTQPEWILTKNDIFNRVKEWLAELQQVQQSIITDTKDELPEHMTNTSPKITKGENYRGLPYLVLDYPRYFDKNNVFAIRTMFWWGNFFSVTLHLSGECKDGIIENLRTATGFLRNNAFAVCVNEDEWQHHFGEDNYRLMTAVSDEEFEEYLDRPFLKIAKKIPLHEWDNVFTDLPIIYRQLVLVATGQLPSL